MILKNNRNNLNVSNTPKKSKKWPRGLAIVAATTSLIAWACSNNTSPLEESMQKIKEQEQLDCKIQKGQHKIRKKTLDIAQYTGEKEALIRLYEDASKKFNETRNEYFALKAQDPTQEQRLSNLRKSALQSYDQAIKWQNEIDALDNKITDTNNDVNSKKVKVAWLKNKRKEMKNQNDNDDLPPPLETNANRL